MMKLVNFASTLLAFILPASGLRAAEVVTWPGISDSEAFLKEQWPAGRVLVWAKPGTSRDALRASNWLEYESAADYLAGKPVRNTGVCGGTDTDLILPDAPTGQPYIVGFGKKYIHENYDNEPPRFICRHVTIGKGAALDGGGGRSNPGIADASMAICGNVTVRDGGYIYGRIPPTFYEKRPRVKTESSQWLPARKRFNLLSAAQQTERGLGSRGGIFSGSWVSGTTTNEKPRRGQPSGGGRPPILPRQPRPRHYTESEIDDLVGFKRSGLFRSRPAPL